MPLRQQSLDGFVGFIRGSALHVMLFLENPIRTFFGSDAMIKAHFLYAIGCNAAIGSEPSMDITTLLTPGPP